MDWWDEQHRDWSAGVRQAQRVLAATPGEPARWERLWNRARLLITSPDDAYALGYVGTLAYAIDEAGL